MGITLIQQQIEDKSIIWFSSSNQYVVLENKTADMITQINNGVSLKEISNNLKDEFNISIEEAELFIKDIHENLYIPNSVQKENIETKNNSYTLPKFGKTKFYKINGLNFKVDFQSEFEEYLVHPKFSHLEIHEPENNDHHFQVFTEEGYTFLLIDNDFIGSWPRKEIHYFQGKFSMYVVQLIHNKPEEEWMGIFHASGLGNDENSILLLGDSGNGKSTSLSILQVNGLSCLADDFVPIDIENQHVYTFPSAISIKKNSLETLLPMYPELKDSAEFHFKRLNKIVRFLPPKTIDFSKNLPCKNLVFIKYKKDSDIDFSPISNIEAFQQLIPDSWISNIPENVGTFLKWFSSTNCYQLTYSDNQKMIQTVKNIINNDL
ncbi:hypothetical protein [uncultured Tenacibaculum sp.]|uniref:hypothetical protein n=1 Tax=uncultured Tenacibaculum sp. TaxID=174713 RepID=UPI002606584F|nr:hypothetical protein [uncultured Tenacibaculum sp.]